MKIRLLKNVKKSAWIPVFTGMTRRKKALTLVEVLVAAVILSIAIAGSQGIALFAWRAVHRSGGNSLAMSYAQQVHENLRGLGYNASPEMGIGTQLPYDETTNPSCRIPDIPADHPLKAKYNASLSWDVSYADDPHSYGSEHRYKIVTVKVDWGLAE